MKKLIMLLVLFVIASVGPARATDDSEVQSYDFPSADPEDTPKGPGPKSSSISYCCGNSSISGAEKAVEDAARSAEIVNR